MVNKKFDPFSMFKGQFKTERERGENIVKLDLDSFNEETKDVFYNEAIDNSEMSSFVGNVEHAYSESYVSTKDQCPQCSSKTERKYCSFIYATQEDSRVMLAPAGYFCTACPTVIIDEVMIKNGISKQSCKYRGVVGLDYRGKKDPDYFQTWNGKEALHVFNDHHQHMWIETADQIEKQRNRINATKRDRENKKKKKRKAAARARKKNRN